MYLYKHKGHPMYLYRHSGHPTISYFNIKYVYILATQSTYVSRKILRLTK
jgi:hypothetical protein